MEASSVGQHLVLLELAGVSLSDRLQPTFRIPRAAEEVKSLLYPLDLFEREYHDRTRVLPRDDHERARRGPHP